VPTASLVHPTSLPDAPILGLASDEAARRLASQAAAALTAAGNEGNVVDADDRRLARVAPRLPGVELVHGTAATSACWSPPACCAPTSWRR
jgi:hypothetical protein